MVEKGKRGNQLSRQFGKPTHGAAASCFPPSCFAILKNIYSHGVRKYCFCGYAPLLEMKAICIRKRGFSDVVVSCIPCLFYRLCQGQIFFSSRCTPGRSSSKSFLSISSGSFSRTEPKFAVGEHGMWTKNNSMRHGRLIDKEKGFQ